MLKHYELLEDALTHFPKWTDIRKRSSSKGQQYLSSVMRQTAVVQEEVDLYKKEHFARHYLGGEEAILHQLYVVQIGELSGEDLLVLDPKKPVTTDFKNFMAAENDTAYFEKGELIFKEEITSAKYQIGSAVYRSAATRIRIWNVFDEFALFSGLERYEEETNAHLLNRTLQSYRNPADSTAGGLKNAIQNALINIRKVDKDDIKIETIDEANILAITNEYKTVLETLFNVSHDVYRTKKWGRNLWDHPFAKIKYVPHPWEHQPELKQAGVGQEDDLKAVLSSEITADTTDAVVHYYQQSELEIAQYVRNHSLQTQMELELTKYDNGLKPLNLLFQVRATEAVDITDSPVTVNAYHQEREARLYPLEELLLVPEEVADITEVRGNLTDGETYRVTFSAEKAYSNMVINRFVKISASGEETDLREEMESQPQFKLIEGKLVNTNVRFHGTQPKDFDEEQDTLRVDNGIMQLHTYTPAVLQKQINNMQNQHLILSHSCRDVLITADPQLVTHQHARIVHVPNGLNRQVQILTSHPNGKIVIEGVMNQVGFTVASGQCRYRLYLDGQLQGEEVFVGEGPVSPYFQYTRERNLRIEIDNESGSELVVQQIIYARYTLQVSLQNGALRSWGGLPDYAENRMTLTLTAKSAFRPVLHYVHIGADITNDVYKSIDIPAVAGDRLSIRSSCVLALQTKEPDESFTTKIENYTTINNYASTTGQRILKLDLSRFHNITNSDPLIKQTMIGGALTSYILLQNNTGIDQIRIDGEYRELIRTAPLRNIVSLDMDERIYANRLTRSMMVRKVTSGNIVSEREIVLTPASILGSIPVYRANHYEFLLPDALRASFVSDVRNSETVANKHEYAFDRVYLFPTNSGLYVSNQRVNLMIPVISHLTMAQNFAPALPAGQLMVYQVHLPDNAPDASVYFEVPDPVSGTVYRTATTGVKPMRAQMGTDIFDEAAYKSSTFTYRFKTTLAAQMPIPEQIWIDGTGWPVTSFVVRPNPDMEILYDLREKEMSFTVQSGGFNSLPDTNIDSIVYLSVNGAHVPPSAYRLMRTEGIIVWNTSESAGQPGTIVYRYKKPEYLRYRSITDLYRKVNSPAAAHKKIGEQRISGLKEESYALNADLAMSSDRIIVELSSPLFSPRVIGATLLLTKIIHTESVLVKPGYVYQNGREYYHFAADAQDEIERFKGAELFNTVRHNDQIILRRSSSNRLPNSRMVPGYKGVTGKMDFEKHNYFQGVSALNEISACERFHDWTFSNMDLSLTKGHNGPGMRFTPTGTNNYALLPIPVTDQEAPLFISFFKEGPMKAWLGEQQQFNGMDFNQAVFIKRTAAFELVDGIKSLFALTVTPEKNRRLYLVVTGEGTIDDVLVRQKADRDLLADHTKWMHQQGWLINETDRPKTIIAVPFDPTFNRHDRTEVVEGVLRTAASVQWGLTKVQSYEKDWSRCVIDRMFPDKDMLRTGDNAGSVTTPAFAIPHRPFVKQVVVKSGRVLTDENQQVTLRALTSNTLRGNYSEIGVTRNHVLNVPVDRIRKYMKIAVQAGPHQYIDVIDLYAAYGETNGKGVPVTLFEAGSMISRFYDIGNPAHVGLKEVAGWTPSGSVKLYTRGFKENAQSRVYTDWKEVVADEQGLVTRPVTFNGYQFFQYRIDCASKDTAVDVSKFKLLFEVLS